MNSELNFLAKSSLTDGVYILTQVKHDFEDLYIKVRVKEKRVYSDEELKILPFASEPNPHKKEWGIRTKSFLRFKKYLSTKSSELNILDLGCGNGWFCGQLSKTFNHNFYCADVNLTELKQAARVFKSENIKYIYADVFTAEIKNTSFDLITINAAIQYFPDLKELLLKLLPFTNEEGEIHIIDSPFYSDDETGNAEERTKVYYDSIGFPKMAERYYHHTFSELKELNSKILYEPKSLKNKISKLFGSKDSPFPWVCITQKKTI